jgi:hypothetical protein
MKMTANRRLILQLLSDPIDGDPPPHSASSILYALENAVKYGWEGYDIKATPSKEQLYRTLRDLVRAGLVVVEKQKDEPMDNGLPYWCNYYQLAGDVGKNALIAECNEVHRIIKIAKHGSRLFTTVFDKGIDADKVAPLKARVKALMQRTHPDKAQGLEYEFKMMQEAAKWIKSGLPLPQQPHQANDRASCRLD